MKRNLALAGVASLILIQQVFASMFFSDIRPKDYPKGRSLDIHVGHLISPMTTQKYPFYFLNWCNSNGMHKYTEGQINDPIESIEGVNYFDD